MNILIEITIIFIGFILFFSIKNFLPNYFNEKGKNLATREDIEIITEKVEKIKSEFIKDIEFIKADLIYSNQNKFSVKSAERDALIEINLKYAEWLNLLNNISFSDINSNNYTKLNSYYSDIKLKKLTFDTAEANLHLFLHDEELTKVKADCIIETIKFEYIIVKAIAEMINHYNIEQLYFNGLSQLEKIKQPDDKWIREQMENSKKQLDEIFYTMNEEKAKCFQIVHEKRVVFVKALKQRLHNIMN